MELTAVVALLWFVSITIPIGSLILMKAYVDRIKRIEAKQASINRDIEELYNRDAYSKSTGPVIRIDDTVPDAQPSDAKPARRTNSEFEKRKEIEAANIYGGPMPVMEHDTAPVVEARIIDKRFE